MKNVKILSFAIVASMLVFTACNSEGKEKDDEKNETETAVNKKDTTATTAATSSANTPATTTYTAAQLPAGVKELITKNYPGYAIIKSIPDPLCQGGDAIDVAITKPGAPNLSLIFKPDGSFVQQEEDVALATAPVKIKNMIKAKFADYSAGDQIERLTLPDKSVQYLVDLSKGKITKEVIFSTDGKVVCTN